MNINFSSILVLMLLVSCSTRDEYARQGTDNPKVVAAKGYVVPKDSIDEPKVILIDEKKLRRVPVGKPSVVPTNTNLYPAGLPKIVLAGIPKVITLGQDTFRLPRTVPAIHKPLKAAIPQVVIAKDPTLMDPNPQSFSSFGKLQGLNDGTIESMIEDRNGNLWLGTRIGGVSKYDGKSFTHFTFHEGLTFNQISSMLEDRYGNIWFGSGYGVSRYDGKFITHFTEKEGLIDNEVRSMIEDRNGNLWFATGAGVSQLDPEAKTFTHYTKKEGLSGNDIYSILEDNDGNLWFGTGGGGATRLSQDRKSFIHLTEKEGLSNNYVTKIVEDNTGNLWFSNPSRGASRLSPDWKSFAYFTTNEGLINDWLRTIFEDKGGNIWFGHLDAGACRLSKDGKFFTHFTKKEGLSNLDVRSILEDRSGNLWLGTGDGLIKYSGRSFSHYTDSEGLSNNYVWSILEDKNANLWFGHDNGGVSRLNPGKKSFDRFTWKEGLSGMSVWAILEDKGGNMWFGSIDNGVTQLSADRKYFTHFTEKDGLCANNVLSMLEDKSGNIWFGTGSGGVSRLSLDRKTFTNYSQKEGLIDNFVSAIEEDKNGNFWFATAKGVTRLSKDGKSFTNFTDVNGLSDNIVWSVIEDGGGNLWFGTNDGLSRLSSDERLFTHFTKKEGLCDNLVAVLLEDRDKNLWIGTPFGLNKLDNEKSWNISKDDKFSSQERDIIFKSFTYEDGFLGIGGLANSIFEDRTGSIWMGTNNRITVYHPEGEIPDTIPPNIQLTGLALSNENISWSELENKQDTSFILGNGVSVSGFKFDGISHWYFLPQNLSLAHHNNSLTFNFIGISQKSPRKVKYQYKLEGNDDNWSAISTRSDAPYGNLPPGAYTFRVKAMNSEGFWSDEFKYGFTIRPPWWKTWSAYSLYGLALIGIFLSWRNYDVKRLMLKHRAEHLSELDTLKTRFFANISHEFRTPITLILGPLKELYNTTNNDEQKSLVATMMRNGQRLLRLINQLLDLSKLEAGKMTLLVTRIDLVQFLKDIASSYESLATDKKIRFTIRAEVPELHVYLDDEKIEKVIHNILSNAFKFTNESGDVDVYLREENKHAVISIKDTGIGIPDHQIDKIFDRFYQVDSSQTRSYEGSGIGMALAKELVELHHGTISVESKEGEGSTFTVRLPLNQKDLGKDKDYSTDFKRKKLISDEFIPEVRATETNPEIISESLPVLLIVEDNTDMRNYIRKTLKGLYNVEESVNGKEGLTKAKDIVPDLIISDVMMPEMDGYQLCELIKTDEVTSHIPVILLTAKADQQSKLKGLEQRADDYLLKPFDGDELKLIVRNHIEERQKMRERFSREIMLEPAQISISSQDERFLQKILALIEEHMEDENFSIEDFSREAGYSRMQFYRKIKALAGQTPSQFVRTIRLKRAAQLLVKKSDNVAQIAYSVGFGNLAYFNKCFKDQFGVTPGHYSETNSLAP